MAITLKYWNARGLMDVPRMMLTLKGRDFTDLRFSRDGDVPGVAEAWAGNAVQETLTANLGRMPILEVDGESIGQSAAINFYVAAELGLMGDTPLEGAKIVMIQEHLKEMSAAWRGVMPMGAEVTPEMLNKWFGGGSEDRSPAPADAAGRNERFFWWWAGRIESVVGEGGFAVGSKLSLADVLVFRTFADGPSNVMEPMGSKAHTDAALAACPRLSAIIGRVSAEPGMQKFLEMRAERGL